MTVTITGNGAITGLTSSGISSADTIGFTQSGTGATARTVQTKLWDTVSVKDFGAVGNGVTDDTTAIQAAVTAAVAAGKAVYFPSGTYRVTSTITVTGKWSFYGDGITSIILANHYLPVFEFDINTTSVYNWQIKDMYFEGPYDASDPNSTVLHFIGDNLAYVAYGYCKVWATNFNSFLVNEKATRTTAFGQENMLNWNSYENILSNQRDYCYRYKTGSGTGNYWKDTNVTLRAGSKIFSFEGSGTVVGDIIINGQFGCQNVGGGGGTGVYIGDNTTYRGQIDITGAQFDANVDIPLLLSNVGSTVYTNINLGSNNMGGGTKLGLNMVPFSNSYIEDRDGDKRIAGQQISTLSTGAISTAVFKITTGSYGAVRFKVSANGIVGGVGSCSSYSEYELRDTAGTLTLTTLEKYIGLANCFDFTTSIASNTLTINVTYTPTLAGSILNTTIEATGNFYKIERL